MMGPSGVITRPFTVIQVVKVLRLSKPPGPSKQLEVSGGLVLP